MSGSLNKWVRKFHRWIAYPFLLLIILLIFMRTTETGEILLRIQQAMVFIMAITGCYLLLLPYLSKRKRTKKKQESAE
jgi:hypothetical protein